MEGHIYKPFDRELSDLKENLLFTRMRKNTSPSL